MRCPEIVMSSHSSCMGVLYLLLLIIRDLSSIQCTAAPMANKYQEIKEIHPISVMIPVKL